MRAERLTRAPLEGGRTDEPSLALDERLGVMNDRKSAKDGSVSLLSGEAEKEIRAAGGLCTDRFAANIVTSTLDYAILRIGMRLKIGEAELEIVRVGKPCFAECTLFQQNEPCPLKVSCAFARVLCGGAIQRFDEISILD
jgi:hypothetical protein